MQDLEFESHTSTTTDVYVYDEDGNRVRLGSISPDVEEYAFVPSYNQEPIPRNWFKQIDKKMDEIQEENSFLFNRGNQDEAI